MCKLHIYRKDDTPEIGDELELFMLRTTFGMGGPGPRSREMSHIGSIVVDTLLK